LTCTNCSNSKRQNEENGVNKKVITRRTKSFVITAAQVLRDNKRVGCTNVFEKLRNT